MKTKVTVLERSSISKWDSIARSILKDIKNRKIFVNLNDSYTFLNESESLRAVSVSLAESSIRNLILKCMVDAESRSPGSAFVFLTEICNSKPYVSDVGYRFSVENLRSSLSSIIGRDDTDLVLDAVILAGRKGKILIDPNHSQVTEINFGTQTCKWKPDPSYFTALNQTKVSVENCRIVFIDGIVESVSECHKIFHESYEKKTPIVMFARGFSEEVNATAAVNMQRKTAQVIPILIPFDEVGVNGMADLASCFLSEVVSSDKGQLISNIEIDQCVLAERISCSHLGTEIEHRSNRNSDVVNRLTLRLKDNDQSQVELLRRRIEAIGSNSVTIKIGKENKSMTGFRKDRVDFGVRYVASCMRYGISNFDGIFFPSKSVQVGLECAKSFEKVLENCGIILEVDRCG